MAKVKQIHAYEIIDSSGNPTIEGRLTLDNGVDIFTAIPSGSSIGKYEAIELRDNDPTRFNGLGVTYAVSYINDLIAPKLIGVSPLKQKEIDEWLNKADGTSNKSRLGSNTTLTISQLFIKAGAHELGVPIFKYINSLYSQYFHSQIKIEKIPTPIFSILNGGKHANNNLDFQEFQIIPSSANTYSSSYQKGIEFFQQVRKVLLSRNANISIGEEGGFTPNLQTNTDALSILVETIKQKNLRLGLDVFLGMDMAASHFYKNNYYHIKDRPKPLNSNDYLEFVKNLTKDYTLLILEDPLHQDDWDNWKKLNKSISKSIYLVGDDLLSSNKTRLINAIKEETCSSILIKPNQIGTITENLEIVNIARQNNFSYIVSQRSAETNDSFIADLAVGVQSDFVKFGAPVRGERVVKYNRLWQIEREELK